jgi:hypothetical protein
MSVGNPEEVDTQPIGVQNMMNLNSCKNKNTSSKMGHSKSYKSVRSFNLDECGRVMNLYWQSLMKL